VVRQNKILAEKAKRENMTLVWWGRGQEGRPVRSRRGGRKNGDVWGGGTSRQKRLQKTKRGERILTREKGGQKGERKKERRAFTKIEKNGEQGGGNQKSVKKKKRRKRILKRPKSGVTRGGVGQTQPVAKRQRIPRKKKEKGGSW